MAKRTHAYLPATLEAISALGAQIGAARRELGWTALDLAGRLGISSQLVARIEKGAPGTAVGTMLEAAVVCGVPLYGVDPARLGEVDERAHARLALLPQRIDVRPMEIDNAF